MEVIDTMIAGVALASMLLWKLAQEPIVWGIIVVMTFLWTGIRLTAGKCPKCHSTDTRPHQMVSGGGLQADWYLEIDQATGDFYAVRYDRVCKKCGHAWLSGLEDVLGEDVRPTRKKISDGETWRRIRELSQEKGPR